METPPIRYARTSDGVSIAYWTLGDGEPLLYMTQLGMCHTEQVWKVPPLRTLLQTLAGRHTIVHYDYRGSGLSDSSVDHDLDRYVEDALTVLDVRGLRAAASSPNSTPPSRRSPSLLAIRTGSSVSRSGTA